MSNIKKKLHELITTTLNRPEVTLEQIANNNMSTSLGITSIDSLEILIAVEREFDITIDDNDLSQDLVSSFSNLESYVAARMQ